VLSFAVEVDREDSPARPPPCRCPPPGWADAGIGDDQVERPASSAAVIAAAIAGRSVTSTAAVSVVAPRAVPIRPTASSPPDRGRTGPDRIPGGIGLRQRRAEALEAPYQEVAGAVMAFFLFQFLVPGRRPV